MTTAAAVVTDGTMVKILPPTIATYIPDSENDGDDIALVCTVPDGDGDSNHEGSIQSQKSLTPPPLPSGIPKFLHHLILHDWQSGEVSSHTNSNSFHFSLSPDDILATYDPQTIRELSIRMKMQLKHDQVIWVGTTIDAFEIWDERVKSSARIERSLTRFWDKKMIKDEEKDIKMLGDNSVDLATKSKLKIKEPLSFFPNGDISKRGGALIVHNSLHGSEKTMLVSTIAKSILKCDVVHVINGTSSLFAKYGASGADAAFETLLHSIILSAAVQRDACVDTSKIRSICIILDHLETFFPPSMSGGRSGAGDPALPALNAMGK